MDADADAIFVALVAIVTANFGRIPGIATAIVGALANNFFFKPPIYTFTPPTLEEYIMYVCMTGCVAFLRPRR